MGKNKKHKPIPITVDPGTYKLMIEIYGPREAENMEIMKKIKRDDKEVKEDE